jgi:signal peptidase I
VTWVARVIACGGDVVEGTPEGLRVNGRQLVREKVRSDRLAHLGKQADGEVFIEKNRSARYWIMRLTPASVEEAGTTGKYRPGQLERYFGGVFTPVNVPPGEFFVMGDNRWLSMDSRVYGSIPHSAIVGRVDYVIWPAESWSRFGTLQR